MPSQIVVIAEIGINHNGDLDLARKLIRGAAAANCQAVKFQKRTIDVVYSQEALARPRESPWGTTQRDQKEGLEFGKDEYDQIDSLCRELGIAWFASAWDLDSQRFLQQYDLEYNKIASALLVNEPLLEMVAAEGRHTFISTGMSDLGEIDRAVEIFRHHECPFELMHTNSTYPTPKNEVNLRVIQTLRDRYGVAVGYSGHEQGRVVSQAAAALGASSIERHITFDRALYGSDQAASITLKELKMLVDDIRTIEGAMGDGVKSVSDSELAVRKKLRGY